MQSQGNEEAHPGSCAGSSLLWGARGNSVKVSVVQLPMETLILGILCSGRLLAALLRVAPSLGCPPAQLWLMLLLFTEEKALCQPRAAACLLQTPLVGAEPGG